MRRIIILLILLVSFNIFSKEYDPFERCTITVRQKNRSTVRTYKTNTYSIGAANIGTFIEFYTKVRSYNINRYYITRIYLYRNNVTIKCR